ncbi:MAG: enoyl-CoA hydratase-related protein [Actinomycetota bacterium]|nr:enoyl-CoA hydratase-related protein [Actinomycetota bacterium]
MIYDTINLEIKDGMATLTLNRPDAYNAFNDAMGEEVVDALGQAARDDGVRALLLTGAGKAFCSGQDLKSIEPGRSLGDVLEKVWNPVLRRLWDLEKPVVAAINGIAAGAGASLALACDLRIASERATLAVVFTKVGVVPDSGITWTLPRLVGLGKALEMAYLADPVDATTAERLGLVNRVVPADNLAEEAAGVTRRLAEGPTLAYALTKRAMRRAATSTFPEALEYEGLLQEIAGRSADYSEGVNAFVEKRLARFQGR